MVTAEQVEELDKQLQDRFDGLLAESRRSVDLDHDELRILKGLEYAIVRKDKMAYVYDFR